MILSLQDESTDTNDLYSVVQDEVHHNASRHEASNHGESPSNDSDATTIDLEMTPWSAAQLNVGSDTSTSLESVYEPDPDYSGPPPQSQPCQKHGVFYAPAGMRRRLVKKRKLNFNDC